MSPPDQLIQPSQVSLALQDLAWLQCTGRLHGRGGYTLTTTILQVNPLARTYVLEGCRTPSERDFLLSSGKVTFEAMLRGTSIRFAIANPRTISYQGGLACAADFPSDLVFAERRQHPRAQISPSLNFTCKVQAMDGRLLTLGIENISQSGVGLSSTAPLTEELQAGTTMPQCSLDFGVHGAMEVWLQTAGHGLIRRHNTTLHLIGCTFISVSPLQRTFLQRLVYQLEMASRVGAAVAER